MNKKKVSANTNDCNSSDSNYTMEHADLMIIVKLCKLMNASFNYDLLLQDIMNYCTDVMNVEGASVLLYDEQSNKLIFHLATGDKSEKIKKIFLDCDEGIAGWVFNNNATILSNNLDTDNRFCSRVDNATGFKTKSILAVPLLIGNKVIGIFELVNKKSNTGFTDRDQYLSEGLAAQIALAVERLRLIHENIAKSRLATIGETVAGLAHYIKNILTGLEGGKTIIDKALPKNNYDIVNSIWPIIHNGLNRISTLTLNMLEFSKDRKPDYTLQSIESVITEVIQLYKNKAEFEHITLKSIVDETITPFYFDKTGVFRCLLNLISNSFDALSKVESPKIFICAEQTEKDVIIELTDNGCGMSEESIKKIMMSTLFSSKGSRGTGLGLPVTRKIIQEHNGKLYIKSELNKGTTFTMILPKNFKPDYIE
ncbi:GAF domain-containing sensor histidine kinase [bacterium]|nr:GAF domain-containing sensor histidine kinase [bacterium]